jgi:hypothetical protein
LIGQFAGLGLLFVPGTLAYTQSGQQAQEIDVYVVQPNATTIQYAFRPQSDFFHRPHVLRTNGQNVWAGEIAESGGVLWHLEIQSDSAAEGGSGGGQHAEHQMAQTGNTMHMGMGTQKESARGEGKQIKRDDDGDQMPF